MIGVIGGTGLNELEEFVLKETTTIATPFGAPSTALKIGSFDDKKVVFLPRHGTPHSIPPHKINYRANIWALHNIGVDKIIAINAVGGISPGAGPAEVLIPDQIIDYTYGREHTFFDGATADLEHIDFTFPYAPDLIKALVEAAREVEVAITPSGTYAATQGPRLETPAEIKRIQRDGGDVVGMTGMPEAALAKEIGVDYAAITLSVNWAAGISETIITMDDIKAALDQGMSKVIAILKAVIKTL